MKNILNSLFWGIVYTSVVIGVCAGILYSIAGLFTIVIWDLAPIIDLTNGLKRIFFDFKTLRLVGIIILILGYTSWKHH